jgi:hypothetical protein
MPNPYIVSNATLANARVSSLRGDALDFGVEIVMDVSPVDVVASMLDRVMRRCEY